MCSRFGRAGWIGDREGEENGDGEWEMGVIKVEWRLIEMSNGDTGRERKRERTHSPRNPTEPDIGIRKQRKHHVKSRAEERDHERREKYGSGTWKGEDFEHRWGLSLRLPLSLRLRVRLLGLCRRDRRV